MVGSALALFSGVPFYHSSFIDCTDQTPTHMNFGQYVSSNVLSLKGFYEGSKDKQNSMSILTGLVSVMFLLQRYGMPLMLMLC